MRYYLDSDTLFIRGSFRASGTGLTGIRSVSSIICHSVPVGVSHTDQDKELEFVAAGAGIGRNFAGLITNAPVGNISIFRYDFVTVFIVAAVKNGGDDQTYSIIITSAEGIADAALNEAIAVAANARDEALSAAGYSHSGIQGDVLIVAGEGEMHHSTAGRETEMGRRINEAVLHGIPLARERSRDPIPRRRPSFFIFSRIRGDHWVEWSPETCQYFPCHFPGQNCDFCYCPFYPCGNETLGQWVESLGKGRVWNCARCTLVHEPGVSDYLMRFPGASPAEIVLVRNKRLRGKTEK